MRARTPGLSARRSANNAASVPPRRRNADGVPTKPTLITPSGSGIIHSQPSRTKWMLMQPRMSPVRAVTLRKCANTAAVLFRLSRSLMPSRPAMNVSRPEASSTKRGASTRTPPSPVVAVTRSRPPVPSATPVARVRPAVRAPAARAVSNSNWSNAARQT